MRPFALLMLAPACAVGELTISPNPITWDEPIDFADAEPVECDFDDGGCAPQLLSLTNTGEVELDVELPAGHDGETVCIKGWEPGEPVVLDTLAPGARFQLELVICGYPPGAIDTLVTGSFRVVSGAGDATVDWAYTPVRDLSEDTGF